MSLDRLAFRQDRHICVVAVQALGAEHMRLDQGVQRLQHGRAGTDQVGQRRQAQIDAFPPIALALPVQRLMLAELLEQDHRQQVRPGEAARRHMERRRRLGDRLAGPAGELLAHGLDHLPLPRNNFQRLGDVFAKLRQPVRAATRAIGRCRDHDALARQVLGKRLARRPLALERLDGLRSSRCLFGRQFILGGGGFQFPELKLHLLQQACRAFRTGAIKLAPQLLDLEPVVADQCFRARQVRSCIGGVGLGGGSFNFGICRRSLRACRERFCLNPRGALGEDHRMRGSKIGGERFRCVGHDPMESHPSMAASGILTPSTSDANSPADGASRSPTTDSRVAPVRSSQRRRPRSATGIGRVPAAW